MSGPFDIEQKTTSVQTQSTVVSSGDGCGNNSSQCNDGGWNNFGGYSCERIAMYIVIILLIIIWTVAIFGSLYSYNGDGDDECRESGYGGAGLAIGFIVWIIFILIFIAAVYYCQWAGVIFFLILTVLVGLGWFWVYQSRRDRRSESC